MKSFYKVIVIGVDVFQSDIIDERHFASYEEAEQYKDTFSGNTVAVIIQM